MVRIFVFASVNANEIASDRIRRSTLHTIEANIFILMHAVHEIVFLVL